MLRIVLMLLVVIVLVLFVPRVLSRSPMPAAGSAGETGRPHGHCQGPLFLGGFWGALTHHEQG